MPKFWVKSPIFRFALGCLLTVLGTAWLSAQPDDAEVIRMESRTFPDPIVWDSNYTAWLAFEVDTLKAGPDGTIYIGESGLRSHLFLLFPWKSSSTSSGQ